MVIRQEGEGGCCVPVLAPFQLFATSVARAHTCVCVCVCARARALHRQCGTFASLSHVYDSASLLPSKQLVSAARVKVRCARGLKNSLVVQVSVALAELVG